MAYGFEFNIAGNANKTIHEMFKGMNDLTATAKTMQKQFDGIKLPPPMAVPKNPFRDIMPSVTKTQSATATGQTATAQPPTAETGGIMETIKGIKSQAESMIKPMQTWKESAVNVATATLDIKKAYEAGKTTLTDMPVYWGLISGSIMDARKQIQEGNWTAATESITNGMGTAMNVINEVRTSTTFLKSAFTTLGEVPVFAKIRDTAFGAFTTIKNGGISLVTDTLKNVVMFAGRSVVSMAGYALSMFGATSAQMALNVAMAANPVGIVIAGIVGVGTAVYGMVTHWETVKSYLIGFGQFMFKYSPFGFVYDIINQLFPNLSQSVQNTFGGVMKWLNDNFLQPIKNIFNWVMDKAKWLIGEVSKPFTVDLNATVPKIESVGIGIEDSPLQETLKNMQKANKGMGLHQTKIPKAEHIGVDKKTKEITGENKQVKNIIVNIAKQIEKVEITIDKSVDVSLEELKRKLEILLLDATNALNYN